MNFSKIKYATAFIALASIALIYTPSHRDEYSPRKKNNEPEEKIASIPNDFFFQQRTYPYNTFDYKAYNAAISTANRNTLAFNKTSSSETWSVEGPGNIGGRFNCTAVHPTNSNIIYAGAAAGGLFKTINGGTIWTPIFDSQPFLFIGCITLDPTNANTLWVGTGDVNFGGGSYIGNGIYKSIDGGVTWINMGLINEHIVSKIIIDPTNTNIIYAATMGQPFVRDNNRGLYKSTDGGINWIQILYINDGTGIIDLVIDPSNPQILYAASYNRIRTYSESIAYGPDSKIWKTTDAGNNWTPLSGGLPNYPVSRIGLAISTSNSNLLYAIITDSTYSLNGIYKTNNAGSNWNAINASPMDTVLYGSKSRYSFGWYFGKIYINPANNNQIYVLGVESYTTFDNGLNWSKIVPDWWTYEVHADQHYMSFINGSTIILSTDGGIYKTTDNCQNWTDIEDIPISQFYHVTVDPHVTNNYWGGAQDNGTSQGNSLNINYWERIFGGDGFKAIIDPIDPTLYYVETQNGGLYYWDDINSTWAYFHFGIESDDRRGWDMPYIISHTDNTVFYAGTYRIYKMVGAPYDTWNPISNDLTDGWNGTDREDFHTITDIDESPVNSNYVYAGTGDANVWFSPDAGSTWNNITSTLPDRYVTSVKASPNISTNVYVTFSGYKENDNTPHVFKSVNMGSIWTSITGDLPQVAINDLLIMEQKENILFAATDAGVYYTINGGVNWIRLGNNMPSFPVFDIEYETSTKKIIAGTFARSIWSVDVSSLLNSLGGMGEIGNNNTIVASLYPNPAGEYLNLTFNKKINSLLINIYSIDGKLVLKYNMANIDNQLSIPVNQLSSGAYLLNLNAENGGTYTQRFIKK